MNVGYLDVLESSRPLLIEVIQSDLVVDRLELLHFYANGEAENGPRPGWRHLFMREIMVCELFNDLEGDYRALGEVGRLPVWERETATRHLVEATASGRIEFVIHAIFVLTSELLNVLKLRLQDGRRRRPRWRGDPRKSRGPETGVRLRLLPGF